MEYFLTIRLFMGYKNSNIFKCLQLCCTVYELSSEGVCLAKEPNKKNSYYVVKINCIILNKTHLL